LSRATAQGYISVMSALKNALWHQPIDLVLPVADAVLRMNKDHDELLEHLMSFWPSACRLLLNYYRQVVWPAMKEQRCARSLPRFARLHGDDRARRRRRENLELAKFVDEFDVDNLDLNTLEWDDESGFPGTPEFPAGRA
jgi:hypothetical protein